MNQISVMNINNLLSNIDVHNTNPLSSKIPVPVITKNSDDNDRLLAFIVYSLSNMNEYDISLINYAGQFNLSNEQMILLLLLNDLYSIKSFCNANGIPSAHINQILELKMKSEKYKIATNYNYVN